MAKRKRRKDAPGFPSRGEMPASPALRLLRRERLELARTRRRQILERTKAGRIQISLVAYGADMRSYASLPVIVGKVVRKVGKKNADRDVAPVGRAAAPSDQFMERMAGPTKKPRNYRCSGCGKKGHNLRKCPEPIQPTA